MLYSYLDPTDNKGVPPPMPYAGLYATPKDFKQLKWSKDYSVNRVNPDAVSYASEFYAKNHIPTNIRPGNNTIENNPYKFVNTALNKMCYSR